MPDTKVGGRSISYEHYSGTNQPIVFIHGWCCARWAFAPQLAYFLGRGHEVLTLDLPGHGLSDALGGATTASELAASVHGAMTAAGVAEAVLIGHSMGGALALVLAAEHPEAVKAVVAVDPAPMIARFPDIEAIDGANTAFHTDEPTRVATMQAFIESFFHPVAPESIKRLALREMTSAPVETMLGCWDALYALDGPATLASVKCPVLHIAATPPLNPVDTFASMVADCTTGVTVGAGHFNQLEVPEQVNSMIERFLVALNARQLNVTG